VIAFRFFGGGFGGQQEEERTPKGHDVYADLYMTLKDLYLGRELKVSYISNICMVLVASLVQVHGS
jgi:DnaJ family protein B protein 11